MTSVKGWHTGRVRLMTLSVSLWVVAMCSLLSCILKKNYLDLKKILSSGGDNVFPDYLVV